MRTEAELSQYCGAEDIIQKVNGFERGKRVWDGRKEEETNGKGKGKKDVLVSNFINVQISTGQYVQAIQKKKAHWVSVENNKGPHTDGLTGTYNEKKSGLKMANRMDISAIVSGKESLLWGLWA